MKTKSMTFIMLLSSNCNFSCNYCYAFKNNEKSKIFMDIELIEKLFNSILGLPLERIDFNWHGGEPLLIGLDYFSDIMKLQDKIFDNHEKKIYNKIQTNASLINYEWIEFFKRNNFSIGYSIDGPPQLHNLQRKYQNGNFSFDSVYQGIKLLKINNIPNGGLLVITKNSLNYKKEIFNFIKDFLHEVDFLPCYDIDSETKNLNLTPSPKDYGEFLIDLFNMWINNNDSSIKIRFFEETILGLSLKSNKIVSLCSMNGDCKSFVSINEFGDIYPCDFFTGISEYKMGNVKTDQLLDIFQNSFYPTVNTFSKLGNDCLNCKWVDICHGGCKFQRNIFNKELYYYCESRKLFYSYVENWIKKNENK